MFLGNKPEDITSLKVVFPHSKDNATKAAIKVIL